MRLLLDTHALIWFCEGKEALSSRARAALEDPDNECFVSHATAWEMAIKLNLGKLELEFDYRVIFPGVLDANGFSLLIPSLAHYHALIFLPGHHGDPFDRLLIAQAQVEGLTIVSCDPHFPAYGVPVLW
jgi:PIN domain nuclease of toxin-antitoxin system